MSLDISVQNLTLKYGSFTAIHDLSFSIEKNKIYGLLGRNGSGKTSLLSVIASYRRQTSGKVTIGGHEPFENAEIMRQVCFIQESSHMSESFKVKDALEVAAACWPAWDVATANKLIEQYRLPLKKPIHALSRGMKSMLGVTIGLASNAPVTIFDEAYLGMDAPARYVFYDELLAGYLANPRTMILSTHLIEEVGSLFEELIIINEGKLLLQENAETFKSRGTLVTGPAAKVEEFVLGLSVLSEQKLGGMMAATVYGSLNGERLQRATAEGLELGPVAMQDLFVHLTGRGDSKP